MNRRQYMEAYRAQHRQATRRVDIVVSLDNWREVTRMAEAAGISTTAALTELVNNELAIMSRDPSPIATEIAALTKRLKPVADRINMLAHHANTVRTIVDQPAVLAEFQKLHDILIEETARFERLADAGLGNDAGDHPSL